MDPVEKKRLANERRLKAIQEWRKKRTQQNGFKQIKNDFGLKTKNDEKTNLKLFDSDDEDDKGADDFKIRPQFEGKSGLHLLEMNSQLSDRFKLDDRFVEDDENLEINADETNDEKMKNIKILESILGHEVSEKYPGQKNKTQKIQIKRFDPENESASEYIKMNDASEEKELKSQKKYKKKKETDEVKEEIVPTSNERYIEVTSNLKDLLNSSPSPFTLTSKFHSNNEEEEISSPFLIEKETHVTETERNVQQKNYNKPQNIKDAFQSRNVYTFFISPDDSRLKEGVEFFQRPKPMDDIREEWNKKKDYVMELFRKKKRSAQRGYINKRPTTQGKRTFIKK